MLAETGTAYEEREITRDLLAELRRKGDLFFQQLPLLEIDGICLVQSRATIRYLARKHDLYGSSAVEAYYCDMIADGLIDIRSQFGSFACYAERKKDPAGWREKIIALLPRYLDPLEAFLAKNNGGKTEGFLLGKKINFVDVALLEVLDIVFELFPDILSSSQYPLLSAFRSRMLSRPLIAKYYSSGLRNDPINDAYVTTCLDILKKE